MGLIYLLSLLQLSVQFTVGLTEWVSGIQKPASKIPDDSV